MNYFNLVAGLGLYLALQISACCANPPLSSMEHKVGITAKSPAEWLEIIRSAPEGPSSNDHELARLELGTMMIADRWKQESMTEEQLDTFKKIQAFMNGRGKIILDKWLANKPLAPEEKKYFWVVKAIYMAEGKRGLSRLSERAVCKPETPAQRYTYTASRLGWELLAKGYRGESLTAEDIEGLREFHMWCCMKHGRLPFLPYCVGLSRTTRYRAGDDFPDFKFKTLESALADPDYSDAGPPEPDYTGCLKPKGIKRFLVMFQGYALRKHAAGDEWCYPISALPGFAVGKKGYIQLSSFRGKKPVVLISTDLKDVYCRRWLACLEPLYQAYKDKVEFLIVNVAFDDWWYLTTPFGTKVDSYYLTYKESARAAKEGYMRKPNVSVPCVLDDNASSFRNTLATAGGGGDFVILDINGKVVYENPGERWPGFGVPGRHSHGEILWLNELETELQALLRNGGQFDTNRPEDYQNEIIKEIINQRAKTGTYWVEYKKWPSGQWTSPVWVCGKITAVDKKKQSITVSVVTDQDGMFGYKFIREAGEKIKLNAWTEKNMEVVSRWVEGDEKDRTYVFRIDDSVELFLNGVAAKFDDFRVGDRVGVRYGYLPDELKEPGRADAKNFKPAKIEKTEKGYTKVKPEHLRASRSEI